MEWINRTRVVKMVLIGIAILIGVVSLVFSNYLARQLSVEEERRMEVWTEAMRTFNNADEDTDLNLVLTVIRGNSTIPVIVMDSNGAIDSYSNITIHGGDSIAYLMKRAARMREAEHIIRMEMADEDIYYDVCYDGSTLLKLLGAYPYIQFGVFLVFVVVALFALLSMKRSEQNRVWVGLSKETAHQLGTPISSLMAWSEILHQQYPDDELLPEMNKDVQRLQMIAERFSKIGSAPELNPEDINALLARSMAYMQRRTSDKVTFVRNGTDHPLPVQLNGPLLEWVVENLLKNAVDAMDGAGTLTVEVIPAGRKVMVDVSDTGKGIAKSHFNSVFSPGFTTKQRGWGLGLSLAKRIVEDYHKGKIYVRRSELGKGTTFRIELKRFAF